MTRSCSTSSSPGSAAPTCTATGAPRAARAAARPRARGGRPGRRRREYTVYPLVACGTCERCLAGEDNLCASWKLIGMHRPGVFAEQVAVPRRSLVPLPPGSTRDARCWPSRLRAASGRSRLIRSARARRSQSSGAARSGCSRSTLPRAPGRTSRPSTRFPIASRRPAASARTLRCRTPRDLEPGAATIALDAAGFEATWRGAIDAVQNGGTVVVLGLGNAEGTFPMALLVRRAITVRGQFAYTRADFAQSRGDPRRRRSRPRLALLGRARRRRPGVRQPGRSPGGVHEGHPLSRHERALSRHRRARVHRRLGRARARSRTATTS